MHRFQFQSSQLLALYGLQSFPQKIDNIGEIRYKITSSCPAFLRTSWALCWIPNSFFAFCFSLFIFHLLAKLFSHGINFFCYVDDTLLYLPEQNGWTFSNDQLSLNLIFLPVFFNLWIQGFCLSLWAAEHFLSGPPLLEQLPCWDQTVWLCWGF